MTDRAPRLLALVGLLALALGAPAAAQSASASVSSDRIAEGERLTYTVALQGGRGARVGPPLATGALRIVSQRPTLDVTTTINGETERRLAWQYEATRAGSAQIGAFRAQLGGRTVSAPPISVFVTAGPPARAPDAPPPTTDRELSVRAEPSRRTALVGQQVVVDYVLYFEPQIQPRQTAAIGTWDAAGAWREELEVGPGYPRAAGDGREAVTIRRVALFPTRAGTLRLAPMRFTIDLVRSDRSFSDDPFAPFFAPFTRRYEDREVTAPAVEIDVRPLPDGAPPSFAGAVGQFDLTTSVDATEVEAGEAVRVTVGIRGDGNVATLEAPALEAPPSVDAYDPAEERELFRGGAAFRGVKTFTYTLVPQGGGTVTVPAVPWSYYDPVAGRYATLETDPIEIVVEGEELVAGAPVAAGPGAPAALMTAADWRRPPGRPVWLWAALGGGLALPALAGGLFLAARAGRRKLAADTPARRSRRAGKDVRRRLAAARTLDGPAAFAEAERAARRFLADRLGLAPTLPADRVAEALAAAGVPEAHRRRLRALLDDLTRGQFAPGLGPDAPTVVDEVAGTLEAIDALDLRPEPATA